MTEQILQNDPNLKLPPSVLAASARADELHRALRDQPEEAEVTSEGNPDTDPAALAQAEAPKSAEKPAEKAEKPAEKPAEKLVEGEESWEHKYKSLHGRFVRQGEQNAVLLTSTYNRVTTVGTAGDSVKLPAATAGSVVTVFNKGANSLNVFPSTGGVINALSPNAAYAVAATKGVMFVCMVDGTWDTILGA